MREPWSAHRGWRGGAGRAERARAGGPIGAALPARARATAPPAPPMVVEAPLPPPPRGTGAAASPTVDTVPQAWTCWRPTLTAQAIGCRRGCGRARGG